MSTSPFVLLPGFLCDDRLWTHQLAALSRHASVRTVDFRHCKSLDEMIFQVEAASRSEKIHLIGFSMGGYIAQCFTAKFPKTIASLTLIGVTGNPLSDIEIRARQRMEGTLKTASYRGISDKELVRYVHADALKDRNITQIIQSMSADNTSDMYLNQMRATLHRQSYKEALKSIPAPITLIGGADDQVAPKPELEQFHKEVSHSQLHMLPECGHYIPLEKPNAVNSILLSQL